MKFGHLCCAPIIMRCLECENLTSRFTESTEAGSRISYTGPNCIFSFLLSWGGLNSYKATNLSKSTLIAFQFGIYYYRDGMVTNHA